MSNWQKKCVKEKICFVEQQKILILLFSLSLFLSPFSLSSPLLSRCTPPFFVLSVLLYLCCWSFLCSFRPFVSLLLRSFLLLPSQRERTPIVLRNVCANGGLDFFSFSRFFFFFFFLSFVFFSGVFYAGFLNVYWLLCLIITVYLNNLKIKIIIFQKKYLKLN